MRKRSLAGSLDPMDWKEIVKGTTSPDISYLAQSQETVYISTCGSLSFQIKEDLAQIFELATKRRQSIILGMDQDSAGAKMTETLIHMLEKAGCSYQIEIPGLGKDWNDTLIQLPNLPEKVKEFQREIAERQSELPKESKHKASQVDEKPTGKEKVVAGQEEKQAGQGKEKTARTRSLSGDEKKGPQVGDDPSVLYPLTMLKGDIMEAKKLVLVSSRRKGLALYEGERKKYSAFPSSSHSCCIHVSKKALHLLEHSLGSLLRSLPHRSEIKFVLATDKETTQVIAPLLEKYKLSYSQEEGKAVSPNLARGIGIAARALLGRRSTSPGLDSDEDEIDEEKKRRRKARRKGYRI
jgi:hypothetical protein